MLLRQAALNFDWPFNYGEVALSGLPANLVQAQCDYFGAHTYERNDRKLGERFHTDWAGLNGSAISGAYDA